MTAVLEVTDVVAGFAANTVLHGVTFSVNRGTVAGIFGLNGAGKSVTMKTLAGIVPVTAGRVVFDGEDITSLSAEARVARGMGHVPQGRQVFPALSVEENLRLGAYTLRRRDKGRYPSLLDGVLDRFPVLAARRSQLAGSLSGGEQASLAVGRALVNDPTLILVDEPSAGLSPLVTGQLLKTLQAVAASGVTMVLVEQNVAFGLQVADTANLMRTGRVVWSGAVPDLDRELLATELGIGPMLSAGAARALGRRVPAATRRPAKKVGETATAPTQKVPTTRSAPAKKAATKKKAAPAKKAGRKR